MGVALTSADNPKILPQLVHKWSTTLARTRVPSKRRVAVGWQRQISREMQLAGLITRHNLHGRAFAAGSKKRMAAMAILAPVHNNTSAMARCLKPARPEQQREPRRIRQPSRLTVPLLIERQLFPKKEIFRNQGRLGPGRPLERIAGLLQRSLTMPPTSAR